jgi:hypothetical protein
MNEKTQNNNTDPSKPKSSMSLADEVLCGDEACIGKDAAPGNTSNTAAMQTEHKSKESQGTRMAIGGTVICNDDACVGKD